MMNNCPSCKSERIDKHHIRPGFVQVRCLNCYLCGPEASSWEVAQRYWNQLKYIPIGSKGNEMKNKCICRDWHLINREWHYHDSYGWVAVPIESQYCPFCGNLIWDEDERDYTKLIKDLNYEINCLTQQRNGILEKINVLTNKRLRLLAEQEGKK